MKEKTLRYRHIFLFAITLITVLLLFCILNTRTANGSTYGNWQYTLLNNKVTITGYSGTDTSISIPDKINGYTVDSIGYNAFRNCSGLRSITIPDSVTNIEGSAFENCSSLTNITIPKGVTSIRSSTFRNCSGLRSITIPDSVTNIEGGAFSGCSSLTNITIPKGVTSIGNFTFHNCSGLTSITLPFVGGTKSSNTFLGYIFGASSYINNSSYVPKSLKEVIVTNATSIETNAFYYCSGLTSITLPEGVTSIGNYAFSGCGGLTSITIPESVTSIGADAFYLCSSLTSISIPFVGGAEDSNTYLGYIFGASSYSKNYSYVPKSLKEVIVTNATSIGANAFSGCSSLTSITIPDSVTNIGANAFYNCNGLTSITIPHSVTNIEGFAFYDCSGLTSITLPFVGGTEDSNTFLGYIFGASKYSDNFSYVPASLKEVIVTNATSIGANAFYNCSGLTSITIPEGVTSIENYTFSGCSGLTSITIPDSVTNIGANAFYNCNGLTSITIPHSVTNIGGSAFSGCSSLTSIIIPDSLTNIGGSAFSGCSSLTNITIPKGVTSIRSSAFENCSSLTNITIPEGVTSIDESVFYGCSNLTSITIPEGVTSIGKFAFCDCNSLTSITIPEGVTSIGDRAFSGCGGLTSITIPEGVTSIGKFAFCDCNSLTSITIPEGVTSIGDRAFSGCSGLTSITLPFVGGTEDSNTFLGYIFGASKYSDNFSYIPASLKEVIVTNATSIGNYTFSGCGGLTSIIIPDSVANIGDYAFDGCSGLTSITIPEGVTSIGNYTFSGCSGLTSITIPEGVTSIGNYTFSGCSSLTSITIPEGVTSIKSSAFKNCSSLTSITIPDSVTSIWGNVFYGCSGLTSITIPEGVTSIGWRAFSGCGGLTSITLPFIEGTENSNTYLGYIFGASSYSDNSSYVPASLKEVIVTNATSIGANAFYNCSGLTSITIPEGVTSIGHHAFSGCSGLAEIKIPETTTIIGDGAFEGCSGLTSIYIPKNVNEIEWGPFSLCSNLSEIIVSSENVTFDSRNGCNAIIEKQTNSLVAGCKNTVIPDGIVAIYGGAFKGCLDLNNLILPQSLTTIDAWAFESCTSLQQLIIPDSVTTIGQGAFYNCSGLTSITLPFVGETESSNTFLGYIFGASSYSNNSSYVPASLKEVVVTKASSIGGSAFRGCSSLTSIEILEGVTEIDIYAFDGCSSLTNITIPEGVTEIDGYAFDGCSSLTNITIPEGVTSIGYGVFYNCSSLTSITIPEGVTSIGYGVFYNCSSLTSITIPEGVTSIGRSAFENCSSLTSIAIPESVTDIGGSAFRGCSGLTNIEIPEGVTNIGSSALFGCSSLTSITLPFVGETESSNTFLGYIFGAGYYWYSSSYVPASLKEVVVTNAASIGDHAFSGCGGLTSITIPDCVISMDNSAFSGCGGLTSITLPFIGGTENSNTYLGYIFGASSYSNNYSYVPKSLKEVIITSATSIGDYAFYNCSELTSVKIPESVTSVGEKAFDSTLCDLYAVGKAPWITCESVAEKNVIFNQDITLNMERGIINIDTNGRVDDYNSAISVPWYSGSELIKHIYVSSDTTYLGNFLFRSLTNLEDVTFNNADTEIGVMVFPSGVDFNVIAPDGGSVSEYFGNITKIENPDIPVDPIIDSYTDVSVTLREIEGYEYSLDGNVWQDSNVFNELDIRTNTYSFFERIKENDVYAPSKVSNSILFTKPTYDTPNAPSILYYSPNSISLTQVNGCEYKMDDGIWQDSNVFEGLDIGSTHIFYQRVKEDNLYLASPCSESISQSTLSNPTITSIYSHNGSEVVLEGVNGYEYSIDGEMWQDSNEFDDLELDKIITIYQRVKATGNHSASNISEGIRICVVSNPSVEEMTSDRLVLTKYEGYEYSEDGVNWQESNIFNNVYHIDYYIYQRCNVSNVISWNYDTGRTLLSLGNIGSAPTIKSKSGTTVILNPIDGCEYSKDGVNWQDGSTFNDLTIENTYSFYQRLKGSPYLSSPLRYKVAKEIVNVELNSIPTKDSYAVGDDIFDVSGGTFLISYNNGSKEVRDISLDMVSGFDSSTIGTNKITITFNEYSFDFNVEIVVKTLVSIDVILPEKLSYLEMKDDLDVTGGKVTKYYDNDTTEVVDLTLEMISGFDNTKVGTNTLTVTIGDKTTTFDVTIREKSLDYILLTTKPNKLSYSQDKDLFDVTGGKVTKYYDNDTSEVVDLTLSMVSGFDNTKAGKNTLTVTVGAKTTTFDVTIEAKSLDRIMLSTKPSKLEYLEGKDSLDVTGGKVTKYYDNDTSEVVDLTLAMVSGFDKNKVGTKTLKVTIGDKTTTFDVKVIAKDLVSILIEAMPTKLTYLKDRETLDLTGGKIKLVYNNDSTEIKNIDSSMVSGFDNTKLGEKTIAVKWKDKVTSFIVTIVEAFKRGDFTKDDKITDKDAVYLLYHTLFPNDYPIEQSGDINLDGKVTDKDAVYLLYHTLFPNDYPLN